MAFSLEEYSNYKSNGTVVSGTQDDPTLTIKDYDSKSGLLQPDIVTSIDLVALDNWITYYKDKYENLQDLKNDIAQLTVALVSK